jgi:ribosomal protein S18 acetylase RimI-like enzyme
VAVAPDAHSAVVEALEANQWALFRTGADGGATEWMEDGEVMWSVSGIPVPSFNGVLRTTVAPDRADDTIDATTATLDSRGVPWSWSVGPASTPLDLGERLRAKGFRELDVLPGMAAAVDGSAPPGDGRLRFEEVREEPSLEAFATLMGVAFDMPPAIAEPFLRLVDIATTGESAPMTNFVALEDGEAVACGSLVMAAGVAGLYNIGVPPERQGQGIGTAMTAALMAEGAARGAETAVLWSSAAGLKCYRALGFEERCRLVLFGRA